MTVIKVGNSGFVWEVWMTVFSFLTYVLWLVFCRHGVIHTQSLQKLLLEDDVTKPGGKI